MTAVIKIHFRRLMIAALLAALVATPAVMAQSADISDEKLEMIRQRCSSIQLALQQTQRRDAVTRINRGRAYDQILRQISALNSRFAYNKISTPDLVQLTNEIQSSVDAFRSGYNQYDDDISTALKTNCKDHPAEFYQLILKARVDRTAIGRQVTAVNELLGRYREALVRYRGAE